MEFLIHREDLMRALTRASGIVEKRSTTPVAAAALFQASGETLRVTAMDKAMTFMGNFPANVSVPGEVAVDAANFFQTAKVLPAGPVAIKLVDNQRVEVRAGRSLYKLNGYPAAEYPPVPEVNVEAFLQVEAADLRRIIDQTSFSVAPDDNRYGLNGAKVESINTPTGEVLRFVGTDGNRLSWAQAPFSGQLAIGRKMLIPRKPLGELRKFIDGLEVPIEIGFSDRAALARSADFTLHMRLLEAEFPNYRDVLPTSFKRKAVLDREEFLEGLRRASIFAVDGSHSVRFGFSADTLVLTAKKLDAGDAREEISVDLAGEPITMGLNAKFVADILAAVSSSRIVMEMGEPLSPCILHGEDQGDALFVVMPVRLD